MSNNLYSTCSKEIPINIKEYNIFLAHPSDCKKICKQVSDYINEEIKGVLNKTPIRLNPDMFEKEVPTSTQGTATEKSLQTKEIVLLNKLENNSLKTYTNEAYDSIETYGTETFRFISAPNSINNQLNKVIFLYSYFGNFNAVQTGQALLHKILLSLGVNHADQTMIRWASHYAIIRGTSKEIKKVFQNPKFIKNKDAVDHFKKLIIQNELGGASSIGLSSMISHIYRFLDEDSIDYSSKHLTKELKKKISFNSQFDHIRPALKASAYLSHVMEKNNMATLLNTFAELVNNIFTSDKLLLNEVNNLIPNFSDDFFFSEYETTKKIIKLYFDNLSQTLCDNEHMFFIVFLALRRLIKLDKSKTYHKAYFNILKEQLKKNDNSAIKNIFLYNIQSDLQGTITKKEAQRIINIIKEKVLNSDITSYSQETIHSFDSIGLFSEMIHLFDLEDKATSIKILQDSLFHSNCSISQKIQIILALEKNNKFIDDNSKDKIQKHLFDNKENLFTNRNRTHFFSFKSVSISVFRALLYRLVATIKIDWADSYVLDLLRISVSTDATIRLFFIESSNSFCKSNSNNAEAVKILLNRCYELSFDTDPKVRGLSSSVMLSLSNKSSKALPKEVLHRIESLSKDSSEIVRSIVAQTVKENKDILRKKVFAEVKNRLSKDIDFFVRKNISEMEKNEIT